MYVNYDILNSEYTKMLKISVEAKLIILCATVHRTYQLHLEIGGVSFYHTPYMLWVWQYSTSASPI